MGEELHSVVQAAKNLLERAHLQLRLGQSQLDKQRQRAPDVRIFCFSKL